MATGSELHAARATANSIVGELSALDAPLLAAFAQQPLSGGLVAADAAVVVARIVTLLDVVQAALDRLADRIDERLVLSQYHTEEQRLFEALHREWIAATGEWAALSTAAAGAGIADIGPPPVAPEPPSPPHWFEFE